MAKMGCAKCGGTKKMATGGMTTKVMGPGKKPFAAGIPYYTGAGNTGPESMKKGGTLDTMARGGTKKSNSAKIVQQFTRKTLSNNALAVRTAGANKARVGKSSAQASVDRLLANKDTYGSKVGAALASSKKAKETQLAANRIAAAKKTLDAVKKVEAAKTVTTKGKKVMNAAQIKAARVTAVERSGKAAPGAAAKYGDIKLKNKRTISAPAPASTKYGPVTRNAAIKTNAGKISTVTKDAAKAAAVKLNMNRQLVDKLKTGEKLKARVAKPGPNFKSNVAKTAEKFKNASNVGNEWKAEAALLKNEAKLLGKGSSAKKLLVGAGVVAATYGAKKVYDYMKQPAAKPAVKPVVKTTVKPVVKTAVKPVASTKVDTNKDGTKTTTYTDASGIKHVKVTTKDGKTFTSNNKPKPAVVTPPKDATKTTPVVKTKTEKTETKKTEVKTPETTTTPTTTPATSTTTPEKVIAKVNPETDKTAVVDRMKNIELSKNPASKKLIESASSNASKTSSAPTTVPRANLINRVRGAINESRERRAVRAEARGDEEKATKLRKKEEITKAKMMLKKGGSVKSKKK